MEAMGILLFGNYPQDPGKYVNGKRISIVDRQIITNPLMRLPVEWYILSEETDRMLLLSKYALDFLPFNDWTADCIWENSTLRGWLNGDFRYKNADGDEVDFLDVCFAEEEREQIVPDPQTGDRVFLLSLDEAFQYLQTNDVRKCIPTAYAVSRLPNTHKYIDGDPCSWWLRTISDKTDRFIMTVERNGSLFKNGQLVSMSGIGVRPALWIKKVIQ